MHRNKVSAKILEVIPYAMRRIRRYMRGLAQPELSILQFRILARLSCHPRTNKYLAEWMEISKTTMSRAVNSIIKKGLISKQSAKFDKREHILALTPKGIDKFETIRALVRRRISEKVAKLSKEQQTRVYNGLSILKEVFKDEI